MVTHSLRNRITVWFTATVIATLACVLVVLHLRISEETQAQVQREMLSAQAVFVSQQHAREENLSVAARVIGDLSPLGEAIWGTHADPATVTQFARDKRLVLRCDVVLITEAKGIVVGDTRTPPAIGRNLGGEGGVAAALRRDTGPWISVDHDRIYQYASAPIFVGGEILGTVTVGDAINDSVATRLMHDTGSQVSFFNGSTLVASSLGREERRELQDQMAQRPWLARRHGHSAAFTVSLHGRQYLSLAGRFPGIGRANVTYLIQESLSDALQPYRETQQVLLRIGLIGLVGAAVVSYAVASGIAQPLLRIVGAAEALGRGDWSQRVDTTTSDEVGVLAQTFNTMAAKLQSWDADLRGAVAERTAELNAMVARLDAAFEQMRRFNADASHELRTPLTIVRGEAEVALRSTRSLAEYERVLQSILEETERMAHIVDQLLVLARADSGELRLDRSRVALHDLLLELQQPASVLARQQGVEITFAVNGPLFVDGDAPRLHELFMNLLDNATKYTPAGGSIHVTADAVDGRAVIRVADTGIGIEARHLPHVFDRFFRTDKARSREFGGSGLGLAICKWIVEAHGGTISVTSTPDKGSVFTVSLKAEQEATAAERSPTLSRAGSS